MNESRLLAGGGFGCKLERFRCQDDCESQEKARVANIRVDGGGPARVKVCWLCPPKSREDANDALPYLAVYDYLELSIDLDSDPI
jgi:hypothetical protein